MVPPASSDTGRGDPTILATATATPPYVLDRESVKSAVAQIFPLDPRRLAGLMALYDHAQVDRRYSVLPLEQVVAFRSLTEKMADYREYAVRLGARVGRECLESADVFPSQVDLVISVSCTGYMVPSLDAYLVGELGLRSNVRRVPITELGCVGGAAALARAADFARALPGAHVLVIAVELSSLTFQREDASDANLVSCSFFGDGAAAALVTATDGPGIRVLDTESRLIPGTLDAMGFDLMDDGFHMVLSKEVPDILRRDIRELVDGFLARNGLSLRTSRSLRCIPAGGRYWSTWRTSST